MRKLIGFFLVMSLLFSINTALNAQEWNDTQKEVWKNVEAYWAIMAQKDIEGFLNSMHDDYLGWGLNESLPSNKKDTRKWVDYLWQKYSIAIYEIKPVGILVNGNVAIVHYYYTLLRKDAEGKEKEFKGRWTDILLKQDDKWLLFADSGGEIEDD
jgi:ketosteroid isomerase-like protein